MKAYKINHKGADRIRIDLPYNAEMILKIKQMTDARWSATLKAWHIPCNKIAYKQLLNIFPEIEIQTDDFIVPASEPSKTVDIPLLPRNSISIEVAGRRIFLRMPKNSTDVQFVRSFHYVRWDANAFVWVIPHYGNNLELLKDYFKERLTSLVQVPEFEIQANPSEKRILQKDSVLLVKTSTGRIRVIFGYCPVLSHSLQDIPYSHWDSKNKWWNVPFSDAILEKVKSIAIAQDLEIFCEEEKQDLKKSPRLTPFDVPNFRPCPESYVLKLKELRYSERSIQTYSSMFEEFINYYHRFEIDSLDESQITAFLRYLVIDRKVSISYQNQSINAIKFYYERVLGGQRRVYLIDRPRTEKTLPVVLNEQEVADILNATKNLKHKAILMTIYSAGLRISEAINLKVKDIDSQRMQIRVEQAKGKKDRYTLLSPKTLEILRKYFIEYKPKGWLFEGVNGLQYSDRSIQAILKDSVSKTNIKKRVTVHTLRHSFATHLLENGTDLRYIQTLLGHESSRTTEIYTHVTTKGFEQIKSSLDKLNIE